jgi:hypothetical protein
MSLPIAWIDRIFDRLTVRYGNRFLDRWKGVNMDAVRYDWSSTLAGFEGWPEAIAFAFGLIDDEKPPTAAMFRSLALKAPKPERLALPEPAADPDRIAAEIAKLEHLRTKPAADSGHGMKAWAYRLKARDEAGESINMNQRRCYHAALGATA